MMTEHTPQHATSAEAAASAPATPSSSTPTSPPPASPAPPAARSSPLPFVLAAAVAVCAAYGGWKVWQVESDAAARSLAAPSAAAAVPLTDFAMTERSGQDFHSQEMLGKVWVASYFFSVCPGECRALNSNVQHLHNDPELADVTWVSISCDPETDTLPVLRDYAEQFQADSERWLFLRGELGYVKRVGRGMNLDVFYRTHKSDAVVIDKNGKARGWYDPLDPYELEQMRAKLVELLAEKPEARRAGDVSPLMREAASGTEEAVTESGSHAAEEANAPSSPGDTAT